MCSSGPAWVVGALAWLVLAACTAPGAPPDPAAIGLQPGDLPASLQRCPASGDVAGYVRHLQATDRAGHDELAAAWRDLQRQGGVQAAVAVFAQLRAACDVRLATAAGSSATSMVVRYQDDRAAAAAYKRGLLGFSTPSEDQAIGDMTRGLATGIGQNAWVLERSVQGRSLIVGYWQRHAVTVLFLAVDVDPLHAKQALLAVAGRTP